MPGCRRASVRRQPVCVRRNDRRPCGNVRADRSGGEVAAVRLRGGATEERANGPGWPVHKASLGGWSQARYQRSAEEAWAENAKQFAGQAPQN
jgi:release factor family 2